MTPENRMCVPQSTSALIAGMIRCYMRLRSSQIEVDGMNPLSHRSFPCWRAVSEPTHYVFVYYCWEASSPLVEHRKQKKIANILRLKAGMKL
jgi:hypothetical protein